MWVIALEALVALSLLVLIVWLTMSKAKPPPDHGAVPPPGDSARPKDRDASSGGG